MNVTFNDTLLLQNKTLHDSLLDQLLIIKLRFIVYGWICLPISFVGLILNSFTIVVLLHARMRTFSTNIYLIALSIANIVCLINYIFLYSMRYLISNENFIKMIYESHKIQSKSTTRINIHGINYENFLSMILWAWSPIFATFQLFSIYLTCAVTVDRWIYLLFPLKAERMCTIRRTLWTIFGIFLFCLIFNLPRWFEVTYGKRFDIRTNRTLYYAKSTDFGNNQLAKSILRYYAYIIHVYGIPFSVLLIVNIGIIQKLIQMKKRKQLLLGVPKNVPAQVTRKSSANVSLINNNGSSTTTSSQVKIDPRITFMVLTVVIAFFICQFPYLIVTIVSVNHTTTWLHILKIFSDLLTITNCCINFLIYCLFSKKFRETANEILLNNKKFCKNRNKNLPLNVSRDQRKLIK